MKSISISKVLVKSTLYSACPKDYPYAMYNGAWCCHVNGKVDYKKEYENTVGF